MFSHPPSGADVQATRIVRNRLQMIAPRGHWAVGRAQLAFAELRQERRGRRLLYAAMELLRFMARTELR